MIIKINDPLVGQISNDSELKSVYITRNGVNVHFPISGTAIAIDLHTIEQLSELRFNTDSKASVVLDSGTSRITVTAEDLSQTIYTYTLTHTTPFSGSVPNVTSVKDSATNDGLVGVPVRELLGSGNDSYNVWVSDLVVATDYQNVSFTGNVFVELQDVNAINPNIPSALANLLMTTGYAYYIVGFGDGVGGSDWATYNNFSENFIYYRVVEDATRFDTVTTSLIKPNEVDDLYAYLLPDTVVILDSNTPTLLSTIQTEYSAFTDVATLRTALDGVSIPYKAIGVDIQTTDIEKVVTDLTIDECVALNSAQTLQLFTLDDLYVLNKTIAQKLKESANIAYFPFIKQFADEILSGDSGYVPKYGERTHLDMKAEVRSLVNTEFANPMFWIHPDGIGITITKFILQRYQFIQANIELFDFKISKDTIDKLVFAFDELIKYYYTYGTVDTYALDQGVYSTLSTFSGHLVDSFDLTKNNYASY